VYEFDPQSRDGELFGTQRRAGFITSGIYVNRPQGLPPDVAGISFMQGPKIHTIYPQGGTVVTFLDPAVLHRVIAAGNTGTAVTKRNFIQRSAIFTEFFTTRELVEQGAQLYGGVEHPIFSKVSTPAHFRSTKKVYKQLVKYWRGVSQQFGVPLNQIRNRIRTAPEAHINNLFAYQHPEFVNFVASLNPPVPIKPPANFFVSKVKGEAPNKRQKLLNLHNLYTNLATSFTGQRVNQPNYITYYPNA